MIDTSALSETSFDSNNNPKKKKISKKEAFKIMIKRISNTIKDSVPLNNYFADFLKNSSKRESEKNNCFNFSNIMCIILENPYLLNSLITFSDDYKYFNCFFNSFGKEISLQAKISKTKPFNLFHTLFDRYKKLYSLKYCDTDYVLERNFEVIDIIVDLFPCFSVLEYDLNNKVVSNQLRKGLVEFIDREGCLVFLSTLVDETSDVGDEKLLNNKSNTKKRSSLVSNCGNNNNNGQVLYQILGYYEYDEEVIFKEYKTNTNRQVFSSDNYGTFCDDGFEEKTAIEIFFKIKTFKEENNLNSDYSKNALIEKGELDLVNDLYEAGRRCLYTWICKYTKTIIGKYYFYLYL